MTNIKASNYRKSYIKLLESCGYKLPADLKEYDVHHLDCDRKNHSIFNLVLIERKLHRRFHLAAYNLQYSGLEYKNVIKEMKWHQNVLDKGLSSNDNDFHENMINSYLIDKSLHENMIETRKEVSKIAKKQHSFISKNHTF